MTHYKAFTELRPFQGRTLCGLDFEALTINIALVDCDRCKAIHKDLEESGVEINVEVGI